MKTLSLLLLLTFAVLSVNAQQKTHVVNPHHKTIGPPVKRDTTLSNLDRERIAVDDYKYAHQKQQLFLVKVAGQKKLRKVQEGDWPDGTEYIYSIVKDKQGRIIRLEQSPFSESGDWYIGHTHYFDAKGHTFCFEKVETLFDESVKGGLVMQTTLKYFNTTNKLITEKTTLTDKNSHSLKRKSADFNFRKDDYVVSKTLAECLDGYHIDVSAMH